MLESSIKRIDRSKTVVCSENSFCTKIQYLVLLRLGAN